MDRPARAGSDRVGGPRRARGPAPHPAGQPAEVPLALQPQERISIRAARQGENAMVKAVLDDWFSIIDGPRLQYIDLALQATQDGLAFLVSVGLLKAERKAVILQGFQ